MTGTEANPFQQWFAPLCFPGQQPTYQGKKGSVLAFCFILFSASAGSAENVSFYKAPGSKIEVYIKRNTMKSKTQDKAPEAEFTQNKDH